MKSRIKIFFIVAVGIFAAAFFQNCASTDDLCDRACTAWQTCVQVDGNYINYPYETCFNDCKAAGDWDEAYVACVESQYYCETIGPQCD